MGLLRAYSVETDRYVESFGDAHALHRTDLNALAVIMNAERSAEAMTPGRLAAALHLSAPATSALLRRLEAAGHVRRTHSESDRRQVDLTMTELAHDVGGQLFGPLAHHVGATITSYTPTERALVARFLTDVTTATTNARES